MLFSIIVSIWFTMENPHLIDPLNPHLIDPLYLFLSSKFEMQAVGMKNRTSLHSI